MTRDPRPVPEASPLVATTEPSPRVLDRPAGRPIVVALAAVAVFAPAYLFADPLSTYRLHSDDFAYLGASRSFSKAVSNLFIPHNTHVVPAWRMLTWVVMATAGRLGNLQTVLAGCSYAILVAAILLTARIVTRETRSTLAGLVSASAVGTTSVLMRAATWYSAGQTLWAGFGILATLWYLQGWRRTGRARDLVLAAISAWVAGGMWTIGHVAGPAGAAYLLADGRKKARIASLVPLGTTAFAVLVAAVVGGPRMNAKISFHGRTAKDAVNFVTGATHTFQAIPETLVCGNLGLTPETTPIQGMVLSAAILGLWVWSLRPTWRPSPLEAAGGTILLASYYVEWSFRGYLPFSSLRGVVVPWYDTIPDLGMVLFLAGWWGRAWNPQRQSRPLTRLGALTWLAIEIGLLIVHQPRVDSLFAYGVPKMSAEEEKVYLVPWLQRLRHVALADEIARWQRRHLVRLDLAEGVARKLGIGRKLIHEAFGRVDAPELPEVYDAAELLDVPEIGTETDPIRARAALARFFVMEPEPVLPVPETLPPKAP